MVRERPGVTAAELALASGVQQATLYGLLRRLLERGELARRELPGGQTGYVLGEGETAGSGREPVDAAADADDAGPAGAGASGS